MQGLLTFKTVAGEFLHKSVRGLQKDIVAGRFAPEIIRLGRSVRVRADELQAWISASCPSREKWLAIRDQMMKAAP